MRHPDGFRQVLCVLACLQFFLSPANAQGTLAPQNVDPQTVVRASDIQKRLAAGEIIVESQDIDGIRYVLGRVWIDETPERLWKTLVNPFEFERRICKRMKNTQVLSDEADCSLLDCSIEVFFPISDFRYVVESKYVAFKRVDFHRIRGSFRDFRGFWALQPVDDGKRTEVTYSMYIDPGFPVPDWLVRQGIRCELPSVLTGLRSRVHYLKANESAAERRSLLAATASGAQLVSSAGNGAASASTLDDDFVDAAKH